MAGWRLAVLILSLADPSSALAHAPLPGIGGFYGGALHPILVPAHGIALLGLGLLAGQHGAPRWMLPIVVAAGFLAGIAIIAAAFAVEHADRFVMAITIVSGLLVALDKPMPWIAGATAAAAGVALALDSVPDEISVTASLLALADTGLAACLIVAVVAAFAGLARRTGIASRSASSAPGRRPAPHWGWPRNLPSDRRAIVAPR